MPVYSIAPITGGVGIGAQAGATPSVHIAGTPGMYTPSSQERGWSGKSRELAIEPLNT